MITYNKAKPVSNEMPDYKRVPRTDDFSWDLSFLHPYSSLGSHVNYTIINANGILKSLCNKQGMLMRIRGACVQHISPKSSVTSCVSAHLVLIVSSSDEPLVPPLICQSKISHLKQLIFHHQSCVQCSSGKNKMSSCMESVILWSLLAFILDRLFLLR